MFSHWGPYMNNLHRAADNFHNVFFILACNFSKRVIMNCQKINLIESLLKVIFQWPKNCIFWLFCYFLEKKNQKVYYNFLLLQCICIKLLGNYKCQSYQANRPSFLQYLLEVNIEYLISN